MHLQDVSDRIEKESDDSELLMLLQKDSIPVVRGDWKVHLGIELQEGECQGGWKLELGYVTSYRSTCPCETSSQVITVQPCFNWNCLET